MLRWRGDLQAAAGPYVQQVNKAMWWVRAATVVQVLHWPSSHSAPFNDAQMHLKPSVSHCDLIVKGRLFNKYIRSSSPLRRGSQKAKLRESWGPQKYKGC